MTNNFVIGLLSFPLLLALIFLRVPLAAAMFAAGLVGSFLIFGDMRMASSQLKTFAFGVLTNYSLSIIPLFLLMSEFAARGGMSAALFDMARAWLGHKRGGVAMAAVGACAGFGAICGSSLATASTMGKVAYPQLKRAGYSGALSTGALAAGGTLGILIPPSMVLVVYALLAEENIERLFVAAFAPGVLALLGYMAVVALLARSAAHTAARLPRASGAERRQKTRAVLPVLSVFVLVIGGIYTGAFSPTAAAAVGAAAVGGIGVWQKNLSAAQIKESLLAAGKTSGMLFFIILAAGVYNGFLAAAGAPQFLAEALAESAANPWLVLACMLLLYLALGTVMDSLAMIFLTVPIFAPIVTGLDFGLTPAEIGIWFGILVLMAAEVGMITPPVGLNLFVINAMAKDVPIGQTYRGALPFVVSDLLRLVVLVAFPAISLFAVRLLYD